MPKVAIISDIHSNLEALEAVLADIDSQSVDEVFCLGDIVGYGPDPIACIDLVMERCTRVVCGNHDEALFKGAYGFHRVARDAIDWTRKILKPSWLRPASKRRWTYLAQLPLVKHWNDNLLVHGSPRQPTEEYVTPNHAAWPPPGMFEEIFAAFSSVCCVGHTHFAGVFAEGPRFTPQADFSGGFKAEGTLELWAAPAKRGRAWVRVQDFPICASSGDLGPKLRQGDGQVPEGVYAVDRFNPISAYHLSLGLSYPNTYDRARTRAQVGREADPGDNIFVHGSCVTVGCLPLRDAPMERLYLASIAARDAGQRRIPVHVFPCHLDSVACHLRLANAVIEEPALGDFWAGLLPTFQAFEDARVPPRVRVRRDGYHLRPRAGS